MAIITDTHKVITLLQQRGFSEAQAQGVIDAIKEVDTSELASKSDMDKLTSKVNVLIGVNIATFAGVLSLMLNTIF